MANTKGQEVWKTYPEYPWIEASNLGRVRTKDRYVTYSDGRGRLYKGHILKQYLRKDGYMYVQAGVNGKITNLYVHRVIATLFLPNPNNLPEVNHKDNDRANNEVSNLEWCTAQYNNDYRNNFGTSPTQIFGCSVFAANPETSEVFWFESQSEAARQLDANSSSIAKVIKGKLNKTHGHWFCRADENAVEKTRVKFGDEIAEKVKKLLNEHRN